MKKYLYISVCALAGLLLASCERSEPTEIPSLEKDIVVVSVDNLVFLPEGGTGTIEVSTAENFTVSSDKNWCTTAVSGQKVTVTVTANPSLEARYARLELKTATSVQRVVVQQVGEVLGGLNGMTDLTAPVDGAVVEIPVTTNMNLSVVADKDWIQIEKIEDDDNLVVRITIPRNTAVGVRTGKVIYTAGSQTGTINVLQYPQVTRTEGWTLNVEEGSYSYPHQTNTATVAADASVADQKYVFTVVPKSAVTGSVEDYIFDVYAVSAKRAIDDGVAAGTYASFSDALLSGNQSAQFQDLPSSVYVLLVGYDETGYVTGLYQWAEVTVADMVPAYYRWPGVWEVSSGSFKEQWTITLDESNLEKSLFVSGMNSITTTSVVNNNADVMVFTYNADGSITMKSQKGKEFHYSDSYGTCTLQVQGRYTANGGTSFSRVSSMGYELFTCTLSSDLSTATMTVGERTTTAGTFPYVEFRLWLVRNDTGGTYSLNASTGLVPIPLAMRRIE